MDLREIVFRALDNALANGYEQFLLNPRDEVAEDLTTYDADLEDVDPERIIPHVNAWFLDCRGE